MLFQRIAVFLTFLGCGKMFVLNFLFHGILILPKVFCSIFILILFNLFLCNAHQNMSWISWPRYWEAFPPRRARFGASPASGALGCTFLLGSFCLSLPTLPKSCSSCLMQIVGFSNSESALCLHESVFLLAFPGKLYCGSVHFP